MLFPYVLGAESQPAASNNTAEFMWILGFGVLVILIAALVTLRREQFSSATFMRMTGLLSIASIAGALVVLDIAGESLTAAFTVLGTIAGYLAGAQSKTTAVVPSGPASTDTGESEGGDGDGDGDAAGAFAPGSPTRPTGQPSSQTIVVTEGI